MRSKLLLIALGSTLAACNTPDVPNRGLAAVNVPVVTTADYVFDAAAPSGALAPGETDRLNGWFQGLGLGYGDSIYVDGGYSETARSQVAAVAGKYGMMVSAGAPVTAGMVSPGVVRVVVARRRATVPNCPNWSIPSEPNWDNGSSSNYGCGVNGNLAMQVANPVDLIHGQDGGAAVDSMTGAKAIQMYRDWPLTGVQPGQTLRP
ncbi:MAG: CpaD family pilus assembly lipoprotein, partial [Pseudomonadota bacterium]